MSCRLRRVSASGRRLRSSGLCVIGPSARLGRRLPMSCRLRRVSASGRRLRSSGLSVIGPSARMGSRLRRVAARAGPCPLDLRPRRVGERAPRRAASSIGSSAPNEPPSPTGLCLRQISASGGSQPVSGPSPSRVPARLGSQPVSGLSPSRVSARLGSQPVSGLSLSRVSACLASPRSSGFALRRVCVSVGTLRPSGLWPPAGRLRPSYTDLSCGSRGRDGPSAGGPVTAGGVSRPARWDRSRWCRNSKPAPDCRRTPRRWASSRNVIRRHGIRPVAASQARATVKRPQALSASAADPGGSHSRVPMCTSPPQSPAASPPVRRPRPPAARPCRRG